VDDHHHLAASFVGLHDAMRLADFLEAKDPGRLRLETPRRHQFGDLLERHVGQWELRLAEHETAEESQVDAAGHLQERIEIGDWRQAAQPARQAGATTPAQHGEGIENGAVTDKIEHRIELLGFSDPLRKLRPLRFDAICAKLLQQGDALTAARGGDDPHACLGSHIERRLAEGGCRAPYDQRLSPDDLQIAEQAGPGGRIGFRDSGQLSPGQIGLDRGDVRRPHSGVFGIAAR
jgi:hypothetical protein